MRKLFVVSILFCITTGGWINAQDISSENGFNRFYYPNGKVSSEGNMRNGKPDGFWKTFYPSGVIKSEGNRRNHLLDSLWVFFNESGDTLQKVSYAMGKRNGFSLEYNAQKTLDPMNRGRIVARVLYVNDRKEGLSFYYYPNGRLMEKVLFTNNKRNGNSYEYDENGLLITIESYMNGFLTEREKVNRKDDKGLKQGVWMTFYGNGQIKTELFYRDDVMNGSYKEYDENGKIKMLLQYANGALIQEKDTTAMEIDIRNKYDTDGSLIYSGSYKENVPVGIHRMYDKTGRVINAVLYNNNGSKQGEGILTNDGKKEGIWKYFYDDGSVRSSGNYVNNLATGNWKFFYPGGATEQSGIFKNGKTEGLWKWYYQNANVKREEEFYSGKAEGLYIEYDTIGEVIVSGKYFDDQKEEEWFYKIGDYVEKGNYIGDLKDGKWQAFYRDGKIKYEGTYIQGNPDGEHVFYYPNGQIKELQYYNMGISEKNWKKYDENGVLLLTITYKDNKEFRINGEKIDFADKDVKLIQ